MQYTCPVCTYPHLCEPPRSLVTGRGSYEICASCGFEFGVTDDDKGYSYKEWRNKWVAEGMPWDKKGMSEKPNNWSPEETVKHLID